jgi:hypothetical protein
MQRLADTTSFSWVLPGHGKWGSATADQFHDQLRAMTEEMGRHDRRSWDLRPLAAAGS